MALQALPQRLLQLGVHGASSSYALPSWRPMAMLSGCNFFFCLGLYFLCLCFLLQHPLEWQTFRQGSPELYSQNHIKMRLLYSAAACRRRQADRHASRLVPLGLEHSCIDAPVGDPDCDCAMQMTSLADQLLDSQLRDMGQGIGGCACTAWDR